MTPLLLSRTCDAADLDHFDAEARLLTRYAGTLDPWRAWEYALALHALGRWKEARQRGPHWPVYLLGGDEAFTHALIAWSDDIGLMTQRVEDVVRGGAIAVPGAPLSDMVLCLSVIEHVKDLDAFLYDVSCLVAPGGLLVLTFAYWSRCGPDVAHDAQSRQRIFCPQKYAQLRTALSSYWLTTFGGLDPTWHGVSRDDYSIASLVVEKRP